MILEFITWNVSPEIFPNTSLPFRWYSFGFVFSFLFGFYIMKNIFKHEGIPLKVLDNLFITMFLATIIGARLGDCFFYHPEYYLKRPWEILYVWNGGLASHGAAIAIILALWWFIKKNKEVTFLWLIDRVVITVALSGLFIRLGNLMNSEIYGIQTDLSWGFRFVRPEGPMAVPKHPTQIYEALSYLLIFFFLVWFYLHNKRKPKSGLLFSFFLILVFTARFFIEIIKENQVPFEEYLPLNMGQILSLPFVAAGIGIMIWSYNRKDLKAQFEQKDQI